MKYIEIHILNRDRNIYVKYIYGISRNIYEIYMICINEIQKYVVINLGSCIGAAFIAIHLLL